MSIQQAFQKRNVAGIALAAVLAAFGQAQAAGSATFNHLSHGAVFPSVVHSSATDLVVSLAGISSFDEQGAAINTVLTLGALPGAVVDQISWTLELSTFGVSWLSEAAVRLTNSNGDGVAFIPGFGDEFSGVRSYADGGSLLADGDAFSVLADGKLYLEFYETWVDNPGAADAIYLSGNITLGGIAVPVPEPATYGLMSLGLIGVALAARRRRQS